MSFLKSPLSSTHNTINKIKPKGLRAFTGGTLGALKGATAATLLAALTGPVGPGLRAGVVGGYALKDYLASRKKSDIKAGRTVAGAAWDGLTRVGVRVSTLAEKLGLKLSTKVKEKIEDYRSDLFDSLEGSGPRFAPTPKGYKGDGEFSIKEKIDLNPRNGSLTIKGYAPAGSKVTLVDANKGRKPKSGAQGNIIMDNIKTTSNGKFSITIPDFRTIKKYTKKKMSLSYTDTSGELKYSKPFEVEIKQ